MKKFFVLLVVSMQLFLSAETVVRNDDDRQLVEESYKLSAQLLSVNLNDPLGNDLLNFVNWAQADYKNVQQMRSSVVFGETVTAVGEASSELVVELLSKRAESL